MSRIIRRPPVVSVMGHVDHGKSSILDYIRKANTVAKEHGGITQHISAYEIEKEYESESRKITFLDTPGHEAFKEIRKRGANVADIAVLVVAADDGVKQQTLDAMSAISEAKIPFVVAINKIDLPNANVQKVQSELIENEVYLEGLGGDVPYVLVSAKTGEGIDNLLDTILLLADLQELTADADAQAQGVVIESKKDKKRGISATLIIKSGTLRRGDFVVAEDSFAPVRIFEDYNGKSINEATVSAPVQVVGFDKLSAVGVMFVAVDNKKEAEQRAKEAFLKMEQMDEALKIDRKDKFAIPVVVCADTAGSKDAILYELAKLENDSAYFKVISSNIGDVSKDDAELALSSGAIVLAFNVKTDKAAYEFARQRDILVKSFNIIYELADFATQYMKDVAPKNTTEKEIGKASILKIFKENKGSYIVGGKTEEGKIKLSSKLKIIRRGEYLGEGELLNLQSNKQDKEEVYAPDMYGAEIKTNIPLAESDILVVIEELEL